MESLRIDLEAEYRAALISALETTAAGTWGLFDHQRDRAARAKAAPVLEDLAERAEQIDDLREKLGMECFALHQEFLAQRQPVSSHAVGEPKQARAWLERLKAQDGATGD